MGLAGRLAIAMALLVATTAGLIGGASVISTNAEVRADIDRFLVERANQLVRFERLPPDRDRRGRGRGRDGDTEAEELIEGLPATDADADVQLLDKDGSVTAGVGTPLPVDDVDLGLAASGGRSVLRTIDVDGVDHRMITAPFDRGAGAVQVALSLERSGLVLDEIRSRVLLAAVPLTLIAAACGWALARLTTRRLRRLTSTVETVAETGDLNVPVPVDGTDEVATLAAEFDRLLDALSDSRARQHQLVQDAAHELRTPLTSVTANVDLLRRMGDRDPDQRATMLDGIRSQLGELNALFSEIVELATDSHDAPPHTELDLVDVAAASTSRFATSTGREITTELSPTRVSGDATALDRAITNLLSNADKFSPPAKPITVTLAEGTLTVRDYGSGIDPADAGRVFDRFYRAESARSAPGSGLGLAIVQKTAADHGGTVFIRPAPGGGTEAGFTLPMVD